MEFKNEDKILCPYCSKEQDDTAIDYTFHYKGIGEESRGREDCCWCDMSFTAERKDEHTILVKAL